MQDVFGMSCDPRPARHAATDGAPRAGARLSCVGPMLAATVIVALLLHLLVEFVLRIDPDDPMGVLSVLLGIAVVLVTLLPFALLFAQRARLAWRIASAPGGEAGRSALLSGRR